MSKADPKLPGVKVLPSKNDPTTPEEKTRTAMQQAQHRNPFGGKNLRANATSHASIPDIMFSNMETRRFEKNENAVSSDIEDVESEMLTGAKLGRKGADTFLTGPYEEEQQRMEEEARKAKEKEKDKDKGLKGFTKKLFKKEKDKTKRKVEVPEPDYRSSTEAGGSTATTSSGAGSYDEAVKFPLPPELTEVVEGERLDMHDVKRISDLKDKKRPPQQTRPDMMRKELEEKKSGGKDISITMENVGSEVITRTIGESESQNSRSLYTENHGKVDSNSSITGSVSQSSEVVIKAHTGSKIENVEESKESIN